MVLMFSNMDEGAHRHPGLKFIKDYQNEKYFSCTWHGKQTGFLSENKKKDDFCN